MSFAYKDGKLVNPAYIQPDLVYATFHPDLIETYAKEIVCKLRCGEKMIQLFGDYRRGSLSPKETSDFIEKMERSYLEYEYEVYATRRG